MSQKSARLRQRLWRHYRALGRSLRAMTADQSMVPGSFYLMRRKCGKAGCRCARGELHPVWVLTRSEAGRHKLYSVPAPERARLRRLTAAWRRSQRARARFVQESAALLALADELAQHQIVRWPGGKKPPS
jgi:hypothetical protein